MLNRGDNRRVRESTLQVPSSPAAAWGLRHRYFVKVPYLRMPARFAPQLPSRETFASSLILLELRKGMSRVFRGPHHFLYFFLLFVQRKVVGHPCFGIVVFKRNFE